MAAATDSHWPPAAGSRPPSSSASSSSSSSWDPWSPLPPTPAAGQKPAWTRPSAASTSVDAGSWPALPAATRSPSSVPINPVIGGDGESAPSAPTEKPTRDGPGKNAAPEPPAGRSDHGPRPRAFAPRGGYGNQRRGNGGGSYNNQGNAYRLRRDSYGHSYHQSQHHVRPPLRPAIFQQPVPFYAPPQIGSYPNVMGFGDAPVHMWYIPVPTLPYPDYVRGSPPPPPPPQVLSQPQEHLRSAVLQQIEYYFSENNLCKDPFLRRHMDEEGWVPISLIAGFKRMRDLNTPIPFILDTMRNSNVVEVKGNMIRTRIDPLRWPLHPPSSTDIQQSYNNLESQMKNMGLNEGSSSQSKAAFS